MEDNDINFGLLRILEGHKNAANHITREQLMDYIITKGKEYDFNYTKDDLNFYNFLELCRLAEKWGLCFGQFA